MSYCRFSQTSEVYMYENLGGGITCCFCSLNKAYSVHFSTPHDAWMHLMAHRQAGHKVPQHALDQLRENAERRQSNEKAPTCRGRG